MIIVEARASARASVALYAFAARESATTVAAIGAPPVAKAEVLRRLDSPEDGRDLPLVVRIHAEELVRSQFDRPKIVRYPKVGVNRPNCLFVPRPSKTP